MDKTSTFRFELPPKIDRYLATLSRLYEKQGQSLLQSIVVNGAITVHEEWEYDNWNGGTYGHALTLTIPEDVFIDVMDDKEESESRICKDVNRLNNAQNEHISRVFLEMEPAGNDQWRENSGIMRPRIAPSSVPADSLTRIWGKGNVRVFLSHKSTYKVEASTLKQSLERCGIASFVAHEDIEPTEEWQREIERALFSMDALVALLTPDYHNSNWTDQEIGVAIGRGVPLIAVRLGSDPYGLMGKSQGLGGCSWSKPKGMATAIFALLHKRLPDKSRVFEAALSVYANSNSFAESAWNVTNLLAKFGKLTSAQVQRVVDAFNNNSQNSSSYDGRSQLVRLMQQWTSERWTVKNDVLRPAKQVVPPGDDVPF